MYKIAAQTKLRFPSTRGDLTVEQLFDMQLKRSDGFDLDTVARNINNELKAITDDSFVEVQSADPRKQSLELALAIVKDVIKTKQEEKAAELSKRHKAEQRQKIMDIIEAKKDAALSAASLEDLQKQLTELSA